jgi:DNA-binding MarR family transcriptional regulator
MTVGDDLDIWRRVNLLVLRLSDTLGTTLRRQHGMGVSEFLTLLSLSEAEGGALRIQSIADAVGLDQSSVSRLIARLSAQGWLERCVCPDDGRGIYAQITEVGRAKVESAVPSVRDRLTIALDEASEDFTTAPIVGRLRQRHRVRTA